MVGNSFFFCTHLPPSLGIHARSQHNSLTNDGIFSLGHEVPCMSPTPSHIGLWGENSESYETSLFVLSSVGSCARILYK